MSSDNNNNGSYLCCRRCLKLKYVVKACGFTTPSREYAARHRRSCEVMGRVARPVIYAYEETKETEVLAEAEGRGVGDACLRERANRRRPGAGLGAPVSPRRPKTAENEGGPYDAAHNADTYAGILVQLDKDEGDGSPRRHHPDQDRVPDRVPSVGPDGDGESVDNDDKGQRLATVRTRVIDWGGIEDDDKDSACETGTGDGPDRPTEERGASFNSSGARLVCEVTTRVHRRNKKAALELAEVRSLLVGNETVANDHPAVSSLSKALRNLTRSDTHTRAVYEEAARFLDSTPRELARHWE